MLVTTNAIVLKRKKLQDNDVLVTLFTDKVGRIKAIAKGAKSGRSGMAAATQPFVFGEFVISMEKEWHKIRSIEILDPFAKYHEDLDLLTYGSYMAELMNFLLPEGVVHHKAFVTAVDMLDALAAHPDKRETLRIAFEIKMMLYSGYGLQLHKCVGCGSANREFLWFSIENGGIICDKCRGNDDAVWQVGRTLPKIMDYMQRTPLKTIAGTEINKVYLAKLSQLLKQYMRVHSGFTGSKSLELLETIRLL